MYAVQGTGNGHVARAREIIPILQQLADVDVWLGGTESEVELPVKPTYQVRGFVMHYNKNGGVSYWRTIFRNNYIKIIRDILGAPVTNYDLVINDFEFITAWACRIRKKECIALSHQASFMYAQTPRPLQRNRLGELILKHYAPANRHLGFHFQSYHHNIFPPVIRQEIRDLKPENKNHFTVYQPAYHHDFLIELFSELPQYQFQIFSKFAKQKWQNGNCTILPISNEAFLESFRTCSGIICGAGFETPAEALYMGKRILVVPIGKQYEQYCNAAALEREGVKVLLQLNKAAIPAILEWIESAEITQRDYPDFIKTLLGSIIFNVPIEQFQR